MADLPRGRTCQGVKTPEGGDPPPWVGTRYGDSSTFQLTDLYAGGFHAGWDVWEVEGAAVTAPRRGVVIATKNRAQAFPDYNVVVQTELTVPSRLHEGKLVKVYQQCLHTHPANGIRQGKRVSRGEKLGSVGFFGMQTIGNPHAHVEYFWSKVDALTYNHRRAVDPYFIRRHYLNEPSPLVLVPARFRWWTQRKFRPGTDKRIRPFEREPIPTGVLAFMEDEAAEFGNEDLVLPDRREIGEVTHACGTGDADPEKVAQDLRANGIEPVYLDGGDLDIETMIAEQEGVDVDALAYGQDPDDDEVDEPQGLALVNG